MNEYCDASLPPCAFFFSLSSLAAPWWLSSLFSSDWNILRQVLLGPLHFTSFQSPLFCVFLCLFYFTFLFFHPPTHTPRVPLLDLPWTTCRWVPLTYQAICRFSRCSWLLCQTSLPLPSLCQNDHHLLLSVGKSMTTQWHTYTHTQKTIWPPKPHLKMPEFNFNSKQKNLPI